MNKFTITFSPHQSCCTIRQNSLLFTDGVFTFTWSSPANEITDPLFCYYQEADLFIAVIGKIFMASTVFLQKAACDLVYEHTPSTIIQHSGFFTIILYDRRNRKFQLFQNSGGNTHVIYYYQHAGKYFLSNTLKKILPHLNARDLDMDGVRDFIVNHQIIPHERTLVKNVKKLLPNHFLEIDSSAKIGVKRSLTTKNTSHQKSKDFFSRSMHEVINDILATRPKDIAIALSRGYDSNLILHFLTQKNVPVHSFTIGGNRINEIKFVQMILQHYNAISPSYAHVEKERIQDLADIVFKNEGCVFERGLFLQYELANLLTQKEMTSVILADCADQVLNHYRFGSIRNIKKCFLHIICFFVKALKISPFFLFHEHRQQVLRNLIIQTNTTRGNQMSYKEKQIDYILKKSGVLMNAFAIGPYYPFLDPRIVDSSRIFSGKNEYKRYVKHIISASVKTLLKKIGGTTDIEYLEIPNAELILNQILNTGFAKNFSLYQKKLIAYTFKHDHLLSLQIIYIHLFDKIFITGNYDHFFNSNKFPLKLSAFVVGKDDNSSLLAAITQEKDR